MAKVTVKFKPTVQKLGVKLDNKLKDAVSSNTLARIGDLMVLAMQRLVAQGISPIKGKSKLASYKPSYVKQMRKGKITGTDGNKYGKAPGTVNLEVSGKFMDALGSSVSRKSITIEFDDAYKDLERRHRTGAGNLKKRAVIPTGKQKLKDEITKIYIDSIKDAVKRKFK